MRRVSFSFTSSGVSSYCFSSSTTEERQGVEKEEDDDEEKEADTRRHIRHVLLLFFVSRHLQNEELRLMLEELVKTLRIELKEVNLRLLRRTDLLRLLLAWGKKRRRTVWRRKKGRKYKKRRMEVSSGTFVDAESLAEILGLVVSNRCTLALTHIDEPGNEK